MNPARFEYRLDDSALRRAMYVVERRRVGMWSKVFGTLGFAAILFFKLQQPILDFLRSFPAAGVLLVIGVLGAVFFASSWMRSFLPAKVIAMPGAIGRTGAWNRLWLLPDIARIHFTTVTTDAGQQTTAVLHHTDGNQVMFLPMGTSLSRPEAARILFDALTAEHQPSWWRRLFGRPEDT